MTERLASPYTRSYLRYSLTILVLVNVLNYMDRSIVGVLIEPMKADLNLSDTEIGLMSGIAFALFYALAGIYISHMADLHNRVKLMSICVVIWSGMTAISGAAQNLLQLLVARVGVGIGEASIIPMANAMIADYNPPERRSFPMALFTAGTMLGVMAGSFLGGVIAETWSWRWAFVAAALPGVPLAIIIWFTLKDPVRGAMDRQTEVRPIAFVPALQIILRNRVAMLLFGGVAFIVFMLFGVITWFPAFLVRYYGMGLAEVGALFGLALGLGTASGAIIGGWFADRLAARDLAWMTRLPAWLMLLMWPLYELAIYAPSAEISLFMIFLVAGVGGGAYGPAIAAIQTVLPPGVRAKGAAMNGFIGSLFGIGGGPLLVGWLSDSFAARLGEAAALQRALGIAVCAAIIGVVFMGLAHRSFLRRTA